MQRSLEGEGSEADGLTRSPSSRALCQSDAVDFGSSSTTSGSKIRPKGNEAQDDVALPCVRCWQASFNGMEGKTALV